MPIKTFKLPFGKLLRLNVGEPEAVNLVIFRGRGRLKVIQNPQGKDKARNWRDPSPDI